MGSSFTVSSRRSAGRVRACTTGWPKGPQRGQRGQARDRNGILERVRTPLVDAGLDVDVFDGGEPEPSVESALRTLERARRYQPDFIMGLGGGSNMDLAKVTAAAFSHGGSPSDYFGWDRIPGPVVPLVCVPTTSGTGSEVSHAAVLTDTANAMKVSTVPVSVWRTLMSSPARRSP